MDMLQPWFRTLGVIALVIAYGGCSRGKLLPASNDKVVAISAVDATHCEVDYPIVFLHSSHNRIQWISADSKTPFWVSFLNLGDDPNLDPHYQAADPIRDTHIDPVSVDPTNGVTAGPYTVKPGKRYYRYAIYSQNPGNNPNNHNVPPCLYASYDHDTGLDVGN